MVKAAATATKAKAPVNRLSQAQSAGESYRYIDKDPDMDELLRIMTASGKSPEWFEEETTKIGRKVSHSTIIGWFYRGVRRPQNYTMTSILLAMGIQRKLVNHDGSSVDILKVSEKAPSK